VLRVEHLVALTGRPGISFEAAAGECVGFLAPASAARRRCVDALALLRRPLSGRMLIADVDPAQQLDRARRSITAHLPEAIDPRLTAGEFLDAVAALRSRSGGLLRDSPAVILDRLGLSSKTRLNTVAARHTAAMAAALLPVVDVVVLHDPFTHLTDGARRRVIEQLRQLSSAPTAIVVTSGREDDVRAISHRVVPWEGLR